MNRNYISLNGLSIFHSKFIEWATSKFSDKNHIHTVSDIENLQSTLNDMQDNVNNLEQTVADLEGNINPGETFETETWTFTLVDGTIISKQVLVK